MPSNTFFRLEKEKQDKILEASKKEFSKFPLEEASIANIVKEAGIPRGSFYQYFTGKEDVFFYSNEGDILNLASTLSQYVFCSIAGQESILESGTIRCENPADYETLSDFLCEE